MAKQPYIFPIVGIRKIEHLHDNIGGLTVRLNKEEMKEIDESSDFIGQHPSQNGILQRFGHCDWVEREKSLNAT